MPRPRIPDDQLTEKQKKQRLRRERREKGILPTGERLPIPINYSYMIRYDDNVDVVTAPTPTRLQTQVINHVKRLYLDERIDELSAIKMTTNIKKFVIEINERNKEITAYKPKSNPKFTVNPRSWINNKFGANLHVAQATDKSNETETHPHYEDCEETQSDDTDDYA